MWINYMRIIQYNFFESFSMIKNISIKITIYAVSGVVHMIKMVVEI